MTWGWRSYTQNATEQARVRKWWYNSLSLDKNEESECYWLLTGQKRERTKRRQSLAKETEESGRNMHRNILWRYSVVEASKMARREKQVSHVWKAGMTWAQNTDSAHTMNDGESTLHREKRSWKPRTNKYGKMGYIARTCGDGGVCVCVLRVRLCVCLAWAFACARVCVCLCVLGGTERERQTSQMWNNAHIFSPTMRNNKMCYSRVVSAEEHTSIL